MMPKLEFGMKKKHKRMLGVLEHYKEILVRNIIIECYHHK